MTVDEFKQLISKYNEFVKKAEKIANKYYFSGYFTGTHFYYDKDEITIVGDAGGWGSTVMLIMLSQLLGSLCLTKK